MQKGLHQEVAWYVNAAGGLESGKLLAAFQQYFRERAESWLERFGYKEAGLQLLLQAFLQRIVNGGGRIERDYGLGRQRVDLLILWPRPQGMQRIRDRMQDPLGQLGANRRGGPGANRDVHGQVRCGRGSLGDLRPQ